ncbi:TrbI/VirB10 family protein [Terriglobus sp. ADX1]|uniref:TrbI/VirB10 family protein n=1 Tax=Terriglobus sp. ADX1 TaxID=2794063 RepID=UPI002FE6201C
MAEINETATVPEQPEAKPPLKRSMPLVIALVVIVGVVGIANLSSLVSGNKKVALQSALAMRPSAPNAQQVSSFTAQQQLQAQRDADALRHQQELATAMQQLQASQDIPGPESDTAPPMTKAQRDSIYGNSSNAPQHTSNVSEAQAEVKQKRLAAEKQKQDALNSNTVAIDFSTAGSTPAPQVMQTAATQTKPVVSANDAAVRQASPAGDTAAMDKYSFDSYDGRLYRIFEGTVLEGVVTNHIDGGFAGPIMVMLATDYYSHDHQQLLMPQGTRLIGSVQSVGNAQQRKIFVSFHRAVCPDGFSIDFDKYLGLDPIGTTGLATKVDHGYLLAFGAAAAIGGLGGLAQIGNNGTVFDPSTQIRNGISSQTSMEGEQVLNHFLNRLPVITLKEGSRARVYIGRDLLVPSYADHRVDPTL